MNRFHQIHLRITINIFSLPDGPIGPLQVDENYTGRGLAKIVTKETLRQIAELGHANVAFIFEWNAPSRAIFEKLGFQEVGKVCRIFTLASESIENSG